MPLNVRTARVIDPILTQHAIGYRNPDVARIGRTFFPRTPVPARGGKVLKFGKEAFRLYNTRRAPGAATKRVQYGYDAGPIALTQESLEGFVPVEFQQEAQAVPGIDLAAGAVSLVIDVFDRAEEIEQAAVATNPANYDNNHKIALAGTDKWTSPNSDPEAQMLAYKEAIRGSTGRYPNTLGLSPQAFNALKTHPKVIDRFKYTGRDSITREMLAAFFDLSSVVVGNDVYLPESAADTDAMVDVWSNVAVLAFVSAAGDFQVPSYGYTYHLAGHPYVEQPYQDRNAKSWFYPITYERQIVLAASGAGFLIQTPA